MVSAAFNGRFFADVMKWRNFLGNGVKKMTEASNYNNVIWNLLETTLSCNKKPNVDSVENMEIDVTPTKAAKENVTDDMQPANEPSTTPRTPSSNRRLLKLRKREQAQRLWKNKPVCERSLIKQIAIIQTARDIKTEKKENRQVKLTAARNARVGRE
uniref:Uncharacterized protein n=2 Tax=Caenorhabditis japonica TaxID=281687 RepID=A0A8R1EEB7_CAEJA